MQNIFAILSIVTSAAYAQVGIGAGQTFDGSTHVINDTGHVSFTGYNISQPFPGSPQDGWSFDLDVAADVSAHLDDGTKGFATVSNIYITPPGGHLAAVDRSWNMCFQYAGRIDLVADDDGTCSSALGQGCIDDWKVAIASEYKNTGKCSVSVPRSCKSRLTQELGGGGCKFQETSIISCIWLALTNGLAWPAQNSSQQSIALVVEDGPDALHQAGNYTAYDKVGRDAHVVLLSYNSLVTNQTAPDIALRCLRANTTTPGSREPAAGSLHTASMSVVHMFAIGVGLFIAL
jgi:hypothetical protein